MRNKSRTHFCDNDGQRKSRSFFIHASEYNSRYPHVASLIKSSPKNDHLTSFIGRIILHDCPALPQKARKACNVLKAPTQTRELDCEPHKRLQYSMQATTLESRVGLRFDIVLSFCLFSTVSTRADPSLNISFDYYHWVGSATADLSINTGTEVLRLPGPRLRFFFGGERGRGAFVDH